jgi:hypothetical protein
MNAAQSELRDELWSVLRPNHGATGDLGSTLARLFKKVPALRGRTDLPHLSKANLHIEPQMWALGELLALIQPVHRENRRNPHSMDGAIAVIEWEGVARLLDGGSRILQAEEDGATEARRVLYLRVI